MSEICKKIIEVQFSPKVCRSVILGLFCFCSLLLFSGCQRTNTIHVYEGEHFLEEQLASVTCEQKKQRTLNEFFSPVPGAICIAKVDNKRPFDYVEGFLEVPYKLLVLPGSHTYGLRFNVPGAPQVGIIPALIAGAGQKMQYGKFGTELDFVAEVGHEYVVKFKDERGSWKGVVSVSYWVEDVDSGEVVYGDKPAQLADEKSS